MSVRGYLILLVLVCGLGGLALAGYIFKQQFDLDADKQLIEQANTLYSDTERFADQARYLFVTSDLLFGAQETYMAGPAEEQAYSAQGLLEVLAAETPLAWQAEHSLVNSLERNVGVLSGEIKALMAAAVSADFSVSTEQLRRVDEASLAIIEHTQKLLDALSVRSAQLQAARNQSRTVYDTLVAWLAAIYVFAILLVLRWTLAAVNKPLVALAEHARLALDDSTALDQASTGGPKEVRELTRHMSSLVGFLDGKLSEFQAIVEAMPDAMVLVHRNEGVKFWKPGATDRDSVAHLDLQKINPAMWASPEQREEIQQLIEACLDTGEPQHIELELAIEDRVSYCEVRMLPARQDTVVMIVRDLTEKRLSEEHIKHMAYHDGLTGLMNRNAFTAGLDSLIREDPEHAFTVLFIDLDRFKHINDSQGHEVGDHILMHVADCIKRSLRASDQVAVAHDGALSARVGGDEFLAVLPGVADPELVGQIAGRLLTAITNPITVRGASITCSVSLGAAIYPVHGEEVEDVIKHADLAMFDAKRQGGNRLCIFDTDLGERTYRKLAIEARLNGALDRQELYTVYQPKLDLSNGEVVGAEALLRWRNAGKLVSPVEFIPVAEESGLIVEIGDWVLDRACRDIAAWADDGFQVPNVAVNVSLMQLQKARLRGEVREHRAEARAGVWPGVHRGDRKRDVERIRTGHQQDRQPAFARGKGGPGRLRYGLLVS